VEVRKMNFWFVAKIETPEGEKELEVKAESERQVVDFLTWTMPKNHRLIEVVEEI
jgi:hypothetical protein